MPEEGASDIIFPLSDQMRSGIYIITVKGRDRIRHTKLVVK